MAPSTSRDCPVSLLSTRDRHKLRKPVVEKMRRDRINSCIEQLKVLLEKEFHKQDPNAKLEKADMLEMTVAFLQPRSHGYSRCWKETLHFLSARSVQEVTLPDIRHLHAAQDVGPAPDAGPSPTLSSLSHVRADRAVWRPWWKLRSHDACPAALTPVEST